MVATNDHPGVRSISAQPIHEFVAADYVRPFWLVVEGFGNVIKQWGQIAECPELCLLVHRASGL